IGRRGAAPRGFRGEGELQVSADGYALKDMRARIGRSDMAGELAFSSAADRGMVRASLASDLLDLDDLLWLAREGGVAPRPSTDALGNVATEVPDFGALRRNDAELRIHARRFHAAAYPLLQSLGLQATLNGGRLALAGIDIGLGKGHVIGRAAVDWRSQPPAAEAELRWAGLHLQALWPDQPEDHRVTGALQGTVAITAAGASGTALLQSASGTLSASLVGGTIAGRLDAEMGLQGGRMLSSLFGGGSERVAIRCAHAVLDVGGGRGRLRRFVVESELTRTTAVGSIGLVDQTLDVVLTPEARKGGLFVLERSIRLHGPMRKPEHTLIDRRAPAPGSGCAA
ncbi:MAG: AsmA family protein, partial [Rhizobacter sp.]